MSDIYILELKYITSLVEPLGNLQLRSNFLKPHLVISLLLNMNKCLQSLGVALLY